MHTHLLSAKLRAHHPTVVHRRLKLLMKKIRKNPSRCDAWFKPPLAAAHTGALPLGQWSVRRALSHSEPCIVSHLALQDDHNKLILKAGCPWKNVKSIWTCIWNLGSRTYLNWICLEVREPTRSPETHPPRPDGCKSEASIDQHLCVQTY